MFQEAALISSQWQVAFNSSHFVCLKPKDNYQLGIKICVLGVHKWVANKLD